MTIFVGTPIPRAFALIFPSVYPEPTDPIMPATSLCPEPLCNQPILDKLVAEALNQSPHFSRRQVRFETQEGDVVLRGTVSSYYHKQMAQEVLRRVDGVRRIENQLEVDWR